MIHLKALKNIIWIFFVQMMMGCIAIYVFDKIMALCGMGIYVGINAFTILFTGVFGIPGVGMLFVAVGILQMTYF